MMEEANKSTSTFVAQDAHSSPSGSHSPSDSDRRAPSLARTLTKDNDVPMQAELEEEDYEEEHIVQDDHQSMTSLELAETKNLVTFQPNDKGNPHNWGHYYRAFLVFIGIMTVLVSVLGSSLPSGYADVLGQTFGVSNEEQLVLPISVWLMGYVVGPLLFGPLSERYGRQIVMFGTFAMTTLFTLVINFSPNWAAFVIFRLLAGLFGSSPISVAGGIFADLYGTPVARGRAMAIFMTATLFGAVAAPIASGYLAVYGWRWPTWFLLAFCGVTWPFLIFLPETYAPVILVRRAKKMRKETPGCNAQAPMELERAGLREIVVVVLTRPIRMLFTEAIVGFSCLYLAFVYAIYYMFFQAYPIIYPEVYGFSLGEEGLTFIAIGIGALICLAIWLVFDWYYARACARGAEWTKKEEYRRVSLACAAGPLLTIGMFWIGWTARPSIHWIVPCLGGLPFGLGFELLFMALTNYIVDAYEIYAASALAAASCSRSLLGATLPFAAIPLFNNLGVAWACSLLGFISLAMILVPFCFIIWGDKIRANSKFCQQLRERKQKLKEDEDARAARKEARERHAARRSEAKMGEKNKEEV